MNRIIFLDIDGVLATPDSYENRVHFPVYQGEFWARSGFYGLNPKCIEQLNRLKDCSIVISSTWRHGSALDFNDLCTYLKDCGIKAPIIGRTPLTALSGKMSEFLQRGEEIAYWLSEHNAESIQYVIFDDNTDMKGVEDHFVHIKDGWQYFDKGTGQWSTGKGLEAKHIEQAKKILEA